MGPGQSQLHLGMTPNRTTGIHSNTESLCVRPWASGRTIRPTQEAIVHPCAIAPEKHTEGEREGGRERGREGEIELEDGDRNTDRQRWLKISFIEADSASNDSNI